MVNPEEELNPNKNYSAQEVKDMLDAQKAKHEQDSLEGMNNLMESKFAKMFDKRLPAGAVVVSSSTNPSSTPEVEIPFGGTPKGDSKNGSPSPYNAALYTYPPAYVPMPHMNPSGNPPKLDEVNFSF
jgi:hypothetical protein